ncbi:MAG: hypothetical protein EOO45_01130 [Flavobacterium sp.]|nr:MAG: hypothetical protein EOO45_01130 [Flavobacterium sp.]
MAGEFNRAAQLWKNWEDKQQMLKDVFGGDAVAADLGRQKYDFLTQGMHLINRPSADEKMVLELITKATVKLEKELYPNPLLRLLHQVKEIVFDKPMQVARQQKMLAANVIALDNTLNRYGFGAANNDLARKLDYQQQSIGIDLAGTGDTSRNLQISLTLEKDPSGRFQLDSFSAVLKDASGLAPERSYRFPAAMRVTAKDAVNLLEGRAVFKQGEGRESGNWLQLDFDREDQRGGPVLKSINPHQGFDLKKELATLAGELSRGELAGNDVLKALEAGKQVAIKPVLGEVVFLEADPAKTQVLIKDMGGAPISLDQLKENKAQQKQELENSLMPVRTLTFEKQKETEQSLGIN